MLPYRHACCLFPDPKGYPVTVFEASAMAGVTLRSAIVESRFAEKGT